MIIGLGVIITGEVIITKDESIDRVSVTIQRVISADCLMRIVDHLRRILTFWFP